MRKHLLHWTTGLGPTLLSSQAAAQDDLTEVPLFPSPSMPRSPRRPPRAAPGHAHARGHDLEIDGATTRCRLRGQERDPGLLPGALILAGGLNGIQVMEVPRWRSPPAAWPSASPPASRR